MNKQLSEPTNPRPADGEMVVRGVPLTTLIATAPFLNAVFLLLRGDRPTENERAMLDAMLVACCDHGAEAPSTVAARTAASTGNALHVALAAGLLAMGPKHGCAVEPAMRLISIDESPRAVVERAVAAGERLPGFGHKVYSEHDPRTVALLARADALNVRGRHVERALAIEEALMAVKGKRFPLNIDGCLAALLLDLRFPSASGNVVFILGRLPGLAAHAIEASASKTYVRAAAFASSVYPHIREESANS
ncbi:citryl-CoA lyase [Candidatus Uhrbacteria bacterium]|nr:citryl-CoA lyase [Candidatus Uhrbacteria bacterium]